MKATETLAKTFLFKDLSPADLKKLAAVAKEDSVSTGTQVFREGETGETLYVIAVGTVKVLKRDKDNNDEQVATLGSGSYFGEMALVDEGHERSATIVAQEPTTLLTFSRAEIKALCEKDDKLAHHFYEGLCRGLVRRLRATTTDAAYYRSLSRQRHG